ncbi:transcription antitermination factor NusB [Kocuria sp. JC486]|uniref:Transcription antitermination protein NusB n=1 Tax=Kocuria soli TaxID=2485125 RepID=A0A3N3ZWG3_9MICC|nr:transcription antitermination factor NusB [Kocuria sp. JC486]ROZ64726.1 transcription antitermination factor NusB [Kocuria soli]
MSGARTKARTRAVEILFEAEQRGEEPLTVLERRRENSQQLFGAYTEELVRGVLLRKGEIDEAIQTWSRGWSLDRMPAVDRNILRLGAWELLFNDDVPDTVAVDEAVGLAKSLSTDDSPSFVNGILGRLQTVKPTFVDDAAAGDLTEPAVDAESGPSPEADRA